MDNLVYRKIRVRALLALLGAKLVGLSWDLPSLLYNTHRTTRKKVLSALSGNLKGSNNKIMGVNGLKARGRTLKAQANQETLRVRVAR